MDLYYINVLLTCKKSLAYRFVVAASEPDVIILTMSGAHSFCRGVCRVAY